jgi:hypothetical protein
MSLPKEKRIVAASSTACNYQVPSSAFSTDTLNVPAVRTRERLRPFCIVSLLSLPSSSHTYIFQRRYIICMLIRSRSYFLLLDFLTTTSRYRNDAAVEPTRPQATYLLEPTTHSLQQLCKPSKLHRCANSKRWQEACEGIRDAGKNALLQMESLNYSANAPGDGDMVEFKTEGERTWIPCDGRLRRQVERIGAHPTQPMNVLMVGTGLF